MAINKNNNNTIIVKNTQSKTADYLETSVKRIAYYEQFRGTAYDDGSGHLTIGYGQKIESFEEFSEAYDGKPPINKEEWDKNLNDDKTINSKNLEKLLKDKKPVDETSSRKYIKTHIDNIKAEVEAWVKSGGERKDGESFKGNDKYWDNLSEKQKASLISLAYSNGIAGMKKFTKLKEALVDGDYINAGKEMGYKSAKTYNVKRLKMEMCDMSNLSGGSCDLAFETQKEDIIKEMEKEGNQEKNQKAINDLKNSNNNMTADEIDEKSGVAKSGLSTEKNDEILNPQSSEKKGMEENPDATGMVASSDPRYHHNRKVGNEIASDTSTDGKMIYVAEQKSDKKENKPENKQDDVVKDFINTLPDDLKGIVNIADIMSGGLFKKAKQQKTPPIDDTLSQDTKDLTQEQIKQTMDSDEYRDSKNPLAELTRGKVNDWFKTFFPGEAKYDETGKMERTPPVMQFPKEAKKPKTQDGNSPNDFLGNIGAGLQTIINATGGNEQKVVKDYQKTVNQANQGTKEPVLKEDGDFGVKTASATKRMGQRKKAFELIDKTAKQTYSNQNMAEVLKRKVDNNKPKYTGEYDTEPRTLKEERKRERLQENRYKRNIFKNTW